MEIEPITKTRYDFGGKLDKNNICEVTNLLPEKYLQLIYIPVRIFMKDERYFFTDKNDIIVYIGHSKSKSITDIINELSLKTSFINTAIAFVLNDKKAIYNIA